LYHYYFIDAERTFGGELQPYFVQLRGEKRSITRVFTGLKLTKSSFGTESFLSDFPIGFKVLDREKNVALCETLKQKITKEKKHL